MVNDVKFELLRLSRAAFFRTVFNFEEEPLCIPLGVCVILQYQVKFVLVGPNGGGEVTRLKLRVEFDVARL